MNRLVARTMIGPGIGCAAFLALCGVAGAQQSPDTELPRSTSPMPSSWRLDVNQSVRFLEAGARPTSGGRCAQVVSRALEAGGLDVKARGIHAKDFGPHLERSGFKKLPAEGYVPEPGDVVDLQPYRGGPSTGHVAIFTGKQWISDFRQKDFYGGSGYRKSGAAYAFYRHANVVVANEPPVDATKPRSQQAAGTKPHEAAMTEAAEPSKPKDEQTEKLQRRAKELADQGWKPREKTPGEKLGEAKVVIPEDCTVEVVTWSEKNPERATTTYRVRGGQVVASMPDFVLPAESGQTFSRTSQRVAFSFSGSVQGNSIVGEWLQTRTPIEVKGWSAKGLEYHYREHQTYKSALEIILDVNGTATWSDKSTWTWKYEMFAGGPYADGTSSAENDGVGVWQIRKSEAVPSESKESPQ